MDTVSAPLCPPAGELSCLRRKASVWEKFGMTLSRTQMMSLLACQAAALRETGRIAFSPGLPASLAAAFCDSPYLHPQDWAQTLEVLLTLFYRLKNETRDALEDETLLAAMAERFHDAGGSLDALAATMPDWFFAFAAAYEEGQHGR